MGYESESRMARFAMLSPQEQAASDAYEQSPRVLQELEAAIAQERDPEKRRILMDLRNNPPGQPAGTTGTTQPPTLGEFLSAKPAGLNSKAPLSLGDFLSKMPDPTPPASTERSGVARRVLGDSAVALAKGVIGVPEAAIGIADLVTGGGAGRMAESAGFRPAEAKKILDEYLSPEQKAATQAVQQADGFVGKLGAAVSNPSTIAQTVIESAPSIGLGGVVGRGAMALAPRMSAAAAGAVGEGITAAGQNAEQVRQEDPNGQLTGRQSAILAASGALTGGLSLLGNKVARQLGIGDVDTLLLAGKRAATPQAQAAVQQAQKGLVRKVLEGAASEGLLEELPQSVQEQMAQNLAQGKPLDENVDYAAVMGLLSGSVMGGAAAPFSGRPGDQLRTEGLQPEKGPATRALNAAVEAAAKKVDAGAPVPPVDALGVPTTEVTPEQALMRMEAQASADASRYGNATVDDWSRIPDAPTGEAEWIAQARATAQADQQALQQEAQARQAAEDLQRRRAEAEAAPVDRAPRQRTDAVYLSIDPVQAYVRDRAADGTPAGREFARDFEAGRITPDEVQAIMARRPQTPDERLAEAAAQAPKPQAPQPGDILRPNGEPFLNQGSARKIANAQGGSVIVVDGGWAVRKASDAPATGGTAGAQPVDLGRSDRTGVLRDQRPDDVPVSAERPAEQGAGQPGAAALGPRGAEPAPALSGGGFIPAPNGYKVRVSRHRRGSNVLDPEADIGAFVYEVRKGDDDPNPLTMVVNKDGKLVAAGSVLTGNTSNGQAWVPKSQAAADAVQSLLEQRAGTKVGTAERKAIDVKIAEAVAADQAGPSGGEGSPALSPDADLPTLKKAWSEAAAAGQTERAREINDRIVALKGKKVDTSAHPVQEAPKGEQVAPATADSKVVDIRGELELRAAARAMRKAERDEVLFTLDEIRAYMQTGALSEADARTAVAALQRVADGEDFDDAMETVDPIMSAAAAKQDTRMKPANEVPAAKPKATPIKGSKKAAEIKAKRAAKTNPAPAAPESAAATTEGGRDGNQAEEEAQGLLSTGADGITSAPAATHKDPGEPAEPVTPAVVEEAIKTAARAEERTRSEMKAKALRLIDAAIAKAPSSKDNPRAVHPDNLDDNERAAQYRDIIKSGKAKTHADAHALLVKKYVTGTPRIKIKVPGDGEFTIINTKEKLREFRKQVETSPGFRDKLPTFPIGKATTSTNLGPDGLAREMLDEGEPVNALEILDAAGKPMMFGNGLDGTAIPYTHSEAVEIGGFPAFVGRGWSDKKGGASGWTVINLKTGLRIGQGDTKAEAMADAKKKLEDPKNADRLARAVKENKGSDGQPYPTQDELRELFVKEAGATQQATFNANDATQARVAEMKKREADRDAAYQAIMGEDAKRPTGAAGSGYWNGEQIKTFLDRAEKTGKVDDALKLLDDLGLTDEQTSTGRMTAVPIQNWRKSYELRRPRFDTGWKSGIGPGGMRRITRMVKAKDGSTYTATLDEYANQYNTGSITQQIDGQTRTVKSWSQDMEARWDADKFMDSAADGVKAKPAAPPAPAPAPAAAPEIPAGYKPAGEPYYKDGVLTQGYAKFAPGDRVRDTESRFVGVVDGPMGQGPMFDKLLVKFDNGTTMTVPGLRLEAEAAAKPVQQAEAAKAAEPEAAAKVDNFGEALPPARRAMAAKLDEDLADSDIANRPLSEIWPLAENEAIEDTFAAAVAHAARAEVPAKPRVAYKLKQWVEKVKGVRGLAAHVVSGRLTRERLIEEVKGPRASLRDWAAKVMLLEQLPREQWKRIGDVNERPDAINYVDGKQVPMPTLRLTIDGKPNYLHGDGTAIGNLSEIRALLGDAAPEKRMEFEIRGPNGGPYKINKKGDGKYRPLMTFKTTAEAREAIEDDYASLVAAWEAVKDRDNITERDLRTAENRPRAGKDWRNGKDATPEQFQEQFGFKGGEFGRWVRQGKGDKERQALLNSAYDALMDLAQIAGVPPRALSLNGTLGIAFGSRGSGWASAHFEPSNLVINLTKTRGAGALAHEWFHALDNYFSRMRRGGAEAPFTGSQSQYRDDNYITHKPEALMVRKDRSRYFQPMTKGKLEAMHEARKDRTDNYSPEKWERDPSSPESVRPEVEQRFAALVQALNESPMTKRAALLDEGSGYWSRTLERAARAFEGYVIARMHEDGYHNDFLVNVRKSNETGKTEAHYPYLLPGEIKPVADAFGALFSEIKTKTDDAGNVALYSRTRGRGISTRDAKAVVATIQSALPNAPDIHLYESVEQAPEGLQDRIREEGAADDVEAVYWNGEIHAFPKHLESVERALFVIGRHEVRHHGMRTRYGKKLDEVLMAMWRGNQSLRQATQAIIDGNRARPSERVLAIEEALADLPVEQIAKLKGFDRFVAAIRDWLRMTAKRLRAGGFETLADAIEPKTWTDADVAAFVLKAEKVSGSGGTGGAFSRALALKADIDRVWRDLNRANKLSDFDTDAATKVTGSMDDFVLSREDGKRWAALNVREFSRDDGQTVYTSSLEVGSEGFQKGTGVATTMYLQALNVAQKRGMGWQSEGVRSDNAMAIYRRLTEGGVPFKNDGSASYVSAKDLAGVDLMAVARAIASDRPLPQFSRNTADSGIITVQKIPYNDLWVVSRKAPNGSQHVGYYGSESEANDAAERERTEAKRAPGAGSRWWIENPAEPVQSAGGSRLDSLGRTRAVKATLDARAQSIKSRADGLTLAQLPDRAGFCFKLASEASAAGIGDMVIGRYENDGAPLWHAVVMRDGMVYDPTFGKWFEPGVYEDLGFAPALTLAPNVVRDYIAKTGGMAPDARNQGLGNSPARLSRRPQTLAPAVTIDRDADTGAPVYATDDITIGFPQETERFEYVTGAGEKVVNYSIGPADGFDSYGMVELVIGPDGVPTSLADIEIKPEFRGRDIGAKVVGAVLAAHPGLDLNISNIVEGARGFWDRMGVPQQNLEAGAAYEGTLNWQTFAQAQNGRGADRPAAGRGAAGETRNARAEGGNPGAAGQAQGEVRFSRAVGLDPWAMRDRVTVRAIQEKFGDLLTTQRSFNWWHRTVGTQFHKATAKNADGTLANPEFKRVYDATQDYLHDTSSFANEAADLAPDLLPQLKTLKDIKRGLSLPKETREKLATAVFEGTTVWTRDDSGQAVEAGPDDTPGIVWTPAELRERFDFTDSQVKLYEQTRASIDRSLDNLVAADVARLVGKDLPSGMRDLISAGDLGRFKGLVTAFLQQQAEAETEPGNWTQLANDVAGKFARIAELKSQGYAPLQRFGRYTLDVVDANGERQFFGLFETEAEANARARQFRRLESDSTVSQGVLSEEAYKQFQGMTPETLELFAELAGVEQNEMFQEYLRRAKNNRSAMKRLIHRKGIAGYSEDTSRVLASFITSNARAASSGLHMGQLADAVAAIPKEKGDVIDEAVRLKEYVQNPQEEAQAIRGLLFAQYLGGSVASAAVNMTQPLMMTLPYLAQFGGVTKAAGRLAAAMKAALGSYDRESALGKALAMAEREGIVSPQEMFQLQAEASSALAGHPGLRRLQFLWGSLFSAAEQFNRRITFVAAYNTAVAEGMADPARFADDAIAETQGVYNKGNKPRWARGAVGATVFTFKQYSVSYMEFLKRLPTKQRLLALAILMLATGAQGMPGADDLDDLIDTLGQGLGYDTNAKLWKTRALSQALGADAADFVLRGFSALPGFPLDVAGRLGLGNLIPGTGLLLKSKVDKAGEVTEALGPAASLAAGVVKAIPQVATGNVGGAMDAMGPKAIKDLRKALEMYQTGEYRDGRGKKVADASMADAVAKAIGFQPAQIAADSRRVQMAQQQIALVKVTEAEIADQIAQARVAGDADAERAARQRLLRWNDDNPESRIVITAPQIIRRVREIKTSRDDRFVRAAPKEMRRAVEEIVR